MKINRTKSFFAFATLASMAIPALADIQYTQETSITGQNNGKPFTTMTIFRRAGADRSEMTYSMPGYEQKTVTITSCALKQSLTLDPALKIYYSTPLSPGTQDEGCGVGTPVKKAGKTGTMTTTLVSLKSLGVQKVGTVATNAYEVIMRLQTSGCLGVADSTSKQHLFIAQGINLGDGDRGCTTMRSDCGTTPGVECNPQFIRKGNWTTYNKLMKGLSLRTRTFSKATDTKWSAETQISNISRAKLSPSLFTIPAGYKKVSATEYQQAQSKAMMDRMSASTNGENN